MKEEKQSLLIGSELRVTFWQDKIGPTLVDDMWVM